MIATREPTSSTVIAPWPLKRSGTSELQLSSTSDANGSSLMFNGFFLATSLAITTSASGSIPIYPQHRFAIPATSPFAIRGEEAKPTIAPMLREIRRRTALTWEQLAKIFGVTRRAVHLWSSGEKVTAENAGKVQALLDRIRSMGALETYKVRRQILTDYSISLPTAEFATSEPILTSDPAPIGPPLVLRKSTRRVVS